MDYKSSLLRKKEQIEEVIKDKREYMTVPVSEAIDELSSYDQHPGDLGTEMFEREKTLGLLELMELELEKVNDALSRYEQGQYGVCEECGQSIEPARLERLVNTTLCAACAKRHQHSFTRPAEEDVISTGDMSDRGETFQVAGYELYE
ncbi:MAG: TraR/DksA C4-type zinc finger protein [Syntrophomonas sp.]